MTCPTCGHPLPDQPRRDPPLATGAKEFWHQWADGVTLYRLRTARDVVDGREGGR